MHDQKKIGVFIAQARERQGISREALARRLNLSPADIAAWEEGRGYPALVQAPTLARELSVSVDELFNARYHSVAEDYQVPESLFLPELPNPAAAEEPKAQKKAPPFSEAEGEAVSADTAPLQPKLPAWAKALLAGCLVVEAVAGCALNLLLLNTAAIALSFVVTVAALTAIAVGIFLFRKQPLLRRQALLLPLPAVLLLLLFLLARIFS